ncbi:MAG: hypothetical protein SWZ49_22660 [Cyanobacteriota bacterium]|nr:hypothetical protein [Cyanobacteriota bacterium]
MNRFVDSKASPTKNIIGATLFLSIFFNFLGLFNVQQANAQSLGQNLEQIRRQSDEAEAQVDKQLRQVQRRLNNPQSRAVIEQQKNQIRKQFIELLSNEQRYKEALTNPRIPEEQKYLLRLFKVNPQALDRFIEQQSDPRYLAEQRKLQIRKNREVAERTVKIEALRNSLR